MLHRTTYYTIRHSKTVWNVRMFRCRHVVLILRHSNWTDDTVIILNLWANKMNPWFYHMLYMKGKPVCISTTSGFEFIKLFSCSNQLSMKFQLLIQLKCWKITIFLALRLSDIVFILFINVNNCWHFNIYEQEKIHAQLSWAWKKFYNLWAWSPSLF